MPSTNRRSVHTQRAVGKLAEPCFVPATHPGAGSQALGVQLGVDCVGPGLPGMQLTPDLAEAYVVLAPAERAGAVPRGKCGGLVEEEQLREAARLHQRPAMPPPEPQPAGDPALAVVGAADAALRVVQAAAVSVDTAAVGRCDQLAHRRDAVLPRHYETPVACSNAPMAPAPRTTYSTVSLPCSG